MEGYLDAFDPKKSVTPAGIFSTRVEVRDLQIELVLEYSLLRQMHCNIRKIFFFLIIAS